MYTQTYISAMDLWIKNSVCLVLLLPETKYIFTLILFKSGIGVFFFLFLLFFFLFVSSTVQYIQNIIGKLNVQPHSYSEKYHKKNHQIESASYYFIHIHQAKNHKSKYQMKNRKKSEKNFDGHTREVKHIRKNEKKYLQSLLQLELHSVPHIAWINMKCNKNSIYV